MALSCIISEIKRSVENRDFFIYLFAFDVPVRGSPLEYCHAVWYGKTRMVGLSDVKRTLN